MADDVDCRVVRSEFSTTDTDIAEDFLGRGYTSETRATITGFADDFRLDLQALTAPRFSLGRVQVAVDLIFDGAAGPDDPLSVVQPVGGRFAYSDTSYPDVHVDTGDVVLIPPRGGMRTVCERFDLAMVQLDRSAVTAYAAAVTGLDPDQLAFAAITPLTPTLARYWIDTITHVRDDVLTDPWAARSPTLLDQAFRTLAAALLSTFPNTALARTTDPEAPSVRGEVSAATLREVTAYLDAFADRPIGPEDIADLAGTPYREVVEGLRRRDGLHPAQTLWAARLRGAFSDLLNADPATETIAAVAARWGFVSRHSFRIAYTDATGGESPEDTLRR
ncbi:hypothetical protein LQ327_23310 [Actinomycetospora endophytica]|uniref:HTH araC/xylS-type domain-containing protein n=1 Tax=Actinomycetospora endophytica TaxID=2291215 RepID=A0ABS8PDF5_9PSEU|nr:hypothetical protein [Actinomycetospora endophytica]MCD2196307.1 hypothetical protein [Actinomycetospora endophytica]